ncbi:MAG TPA: helix-turn-helix transcriptional regulator [Thermoanaerobaculia bacterium]|nr:helix-turn-helix transcriptional regulator [Thermoanaerobaculia bacterium]
MTSTIDPASAAPRVASSVSASPFRNLGRTLRLLRELSSKGLKELAREIRIGPSQLSKYENGKSFPKLEAVEKILGGLNLTPLDLFHTLALIDSRERGVAEGTADFASFRSPIAGANLLGPSASRMLGQTLESLFAFQAEVVAMVVRGQLLEGAPSLRPVLVPAFIAQIEENGCLSLPEEIRGSLGMRTGDILDFEVVGEAIRMTRRSR